MPTTREKGNPVADCRLDMLLTSDVDERDAEFVTGERTAEGFHRVRNGMGPVIARGLTCALDDDRIATSSVDSAPWG